MRRYFDAEAGGALASSVSDVIRNQFKYETHRCFFSHLRYLALPRVVRQEEDMAYTLDNLVISATLPDKIDFHLESYASLDTSALSVPNKSSLQTEIYLTATVRGITAIAPDVIFDFPLHANAILDSLHVHRNDTLGIRSDDCINP
jgi:hypothetical protein